RDEMLAIGFGNLRCDRLNHRGETKCWRLVSATFGATGSSRMLRVLTEFSEGSTLLSKETK
ncbi:MAG: hypothetical protein II098_01075, partial [Treponema sp.]|nr:hypothetical protein [Treponema sp.]